MQNSIIRRIKGTDDILPREVNEWSNIEGCARKTFSIYRYQEIRTPVLEQTGLFVRGVGSETEIVQKQMYTFQDRAARNISLRPEGTAPIIRAYLENQIGLNGSLVKVFYIQPMFRAERPQAGRNRQFHQIGAEAIGSYSPLLDVEMIALNRSVLLSFGIEDFIIKLNSVGCKEDKEKYSKILYEHISAKQEFLCSDCKARLNQNPLRILDCKVPKCREIVKGSPPLILIQCKECKDHYENLKQGLSALNIRYEQDNHLIRGLDYYTKTVFEIVHSRLGSQDTISAGGRYDNLVEELGGKPTGCCGFAIGVERVIILRKVLNISLQEKISALTFIATIDEDGRLKGLSLSEAIRRFSMPVAMDFQGRSLKSQMRYANKLGARWVIIIGEDEMKNNCVTIKLMTDGVQETLPFDVHKIVEKLKG